MKRRRIPCRGEVSDRLERAGVSRRRSGLVQAAYTYFHCEGHIINGFPLAATDREGKAVMYIFTPEADQESVSRTIREHSHEKPIVCLLSPFGNNAWYETCRKVVSSHHGMSIDCGGAVFLFFFQGLNNEHIKL